MNSQQIYIDDVLIHHPVETFFHTSITKCAVGKAMVIFKLRSEFVSERFDSAGVLGLLVDYTARMAGQSQMGSCLMAEHEINCRAQPKVSIFTVNVSIGSISANNATFYCKVFAGDNRKRLIAESHGTLAAITTTLTAFI